MSFLSPHHFLWLLLAVPVVLFYIAVGRKQQAVSSFMLWQRALARRRKWSRVQKLASLTLQLLILGVLVLAMAHPVLESARATGRTIVLIVDTSASMNATDMSPSRLSAAKETARQFIDRLGPHDRMAIVSASASISTPCRFTDNRKTLTAALAGVSPSDAVGATVQAVELARRMLDGRHNPQVIVLSDGAFAGAEQLAGSGDVRLLIHRGEGENVAVTQMEARRSPVDPATCEVLVEVSNFSAKPVSCGVTLELQGEAKETELLEIPSGKAVRRVQTVVSSVGGLLVATLDRADDLAADNRAQLLLAPHAVRRVNLVTAGNTPLQQALQSIPGIELEVVAPGESPAPADLSVLDRHTPAELPGGGVLMIGPNGSCDFWQHEGEAAGVASVGRQANSLLLDHVELRDAAIESPVRLVFQHPADELAAATSGEAVYSAIETEDRRVLVLHAPLDKTDLAMRPSFPILLANAVRWLAGEQEGVHLSMRTDDLVTIPPSDDSRVLRSPYGVATARFDSGPGFAMLGRSGVWQVSANDGPLQTVLASNLLDRNESDLRVGGELSPGETDSAAFHFNWPSVSYLLAFVVVLILAEWFLFHRGVVV